MTWINSYSGIKVEPMAFTKDMVRLTDIATHLSNKNRYTGAIALSVAQHSVVLAAHLPLSTAGRRRALMHDACEAYFPDVPYPIKKDPRYPQFLVDVEDAIQRTIEEALGVAVIDPKEQALIDAFDRAICGIEAPMHFGKIHADWKWQEIHPKVANRLRTALLRLWPPIEARKRFLDMAKALEIQ